MAGTAEPIRGLLATWEAIAGAGAAGAGAAGAGAVGAASASLTLAFALRACAAGGDWAAALAVLDAHARAETRASAGEEEEAAAAAAAEAAVAGKKPPRPPPGARGSGRLRSPGELFAEAGQALLDACAEAARGRGQRQGQGAAGGEGVGQGAEKAARAALPALAAALAGTGAEVRGGHYVPSPKGPGYF